MSAFLASIGASFNLGNRFDFKCLPTDAASVNALLSAYREKGFDGVRISCTWMRGSRCMLDDATYMRDLKSAVMYAVTLGYKVIIDAHFEHWIFDTYQDAHLATFQALWQRIATVFKGFAPNELAFDVLNEPHNMLGDVANCADSVLLKRLRAVNEAGYLGIRQVCRDHLVLFEPSGLSSIYCLKAAYPDRVSLGAAQDDVNVAISVHIYGPTTFCLPSGGSNDGVTVQSVRQNIDKKVRDILKWQATSKIPVHVGEFGVGCTSRAPMPSRRDSDVVREHYRYFAQKFKKAGIVATVWDDGGDFTLWRDGAWVQGLADAMLSGISPKKLAPV
jgi:aryl-phospho-beta-D-glucosidase BglC (GH1 family)